MRWLPFCFLRGGDGDGLIVGGCLGILIGDGLGFHRLLCGRRGEGSLEVLGRGEGRNCR